VKKSEKIVFKCAACRTRITAEYIKGLDDVISEECPSCKLTHYGNAERWKNVRSDSIRLMAPASLLTSLVITFK